ncbi:hypothetical protein [Microbacterium gorillae]|uniref:hypothetical protein n=1 Tax=Microbacterium gorillae TaxID=1231063 RepID=UPI000694112C|nr:hypothetical protein [Microbacterium gorillae]
MSDSRSSDHENTSGDPAVEFETAGDPVADTAAHSSIDDVVDRANGNIADAQNAGADEYTVDRTVTPAAAPRPADEVPERTFATDASGATEEASPAPSAEEPVTPTSDDAALRTEAADAAAFGDPATESAFGGETVPAAPAATTADEPARPVATEAATHAGTDAAAEAAAIGAAAATSARPAAHDPAAAAAAAAIADDDDTPWYDRPEVTEATTQLPESVRDTPLDPPPAAVTPVEETPTVVASNVSPVSQQPIFVQAPEPPAKRGNRGFAGVVALIATVIFAVLYLAAILLADAGRTLASGDALGHAALDQVGTFSFWTPVVVFFLAFWLLGAFINTAKWGYWVVFGLLVGLAALGGHVLGQVLQADPRSLTAHEGVTLARDSVFSVAGLVAFVVGRELPIWFGGWIARRGRRVIVANEEAQEEYQRTLDAGPQLYQQ